MRLNLGEYLKTSISGIVTEAVRSRDIEKAMKLMSSFLQKYGIYTVPITRQIKTDEGGRLAVTVFNDNGEAACFVWNLGTPYQVNTILFTKRGDEMSVAWANGEPFVWDVEVLAKGANLVQLLKLVQSVLTGKTAMTAGAIRSQIEDAQLFESVNESADDLLNKAIKDRDRLYQRLNYAKKRGNDYTSLQAEYDDLAAKISEMRLSIKSNARTTLTSDPEDDQFQKQFEEIERATPEERFEDMESYVLNVAAGIKPLAVLCGAPGVGKTFRVMKTIKSTGKEHGEGYAILKGRVSPSALYATMFDYKNEGQILIMDDSEEVLSDPLNINLIKAAYDSGDERWVTWSTSRPIEMSEEKAQMIDGAEFDSVKGKWFYPKEFIYRGGGIIITNYSAGQIDTAIRNRALMCDLDFTTEEILQIVRDISPKIKPDLLTSESKERALKYLQDLADKKAPMEISIRTFTLCAGLFMSDAPEGSIQRRINEQMRLQSLRGGRKY